MEMNVMTMKMPAIRAVLLSEPVSRSRVADADPFGDDAIFGSSGWTIGGPIWSIVPVNRRIDDPCGFVYGVQRVSRPCALRMGARLYSFDGPCQGSWSGQPLKEMFRCAPFTHIRI
jgi:hypothetical protein